MRLVRVLTGVAEAREKTHNRSKTVRRKLRAANSHRQLLAFPLLYSKSLFILFLDL